MGGAVPARGHPAGDPARSDWGLALTDRGHSGSRSHCMRMARRPLTGPRTPGLAVEQRGNALVGIRARF